MCEPEVIHGQTHLKWEAALKKAKFSDSKVKRVIRAGFPCRKHSELLLGPRWQAVKCLRRREERVGMLAPRSDKST